MSNPKSFKSIGKGVYLCPSTGSYYWRPFYDGKQHWSKLAATGPRYAFLEAGKLRAELAMSRRGLAPSPFEKQKSVADICQFYLDQGCPQKRMQAKRTEQTMKEEKKRVEKLMLWPGSKKPASSITLEHCRDYHAWRIQSIIKGVGDRQVDKELVTLSNAYRCAMRNTSKTGIKVNPIAHEREKFQDPGVVVHCREHQPASGDELHNLAWELFDHRQSQVLGWQLLMEALVGQRSSEILKLRWDAPDRNHPGFIQDGHLYLYRSASSKGTYPFIQLHPALAECLAALKSWRNERHPKSPWFFPSPFDPKSHVDPTSLTKSLARVSKSLSVGHRTSHGLRSFFVNVLRSQGMLDAEIALRIGQKSGGKLIVSTYGEILPYKLSWLPSIPRIPAWSRSFSHTTLHTSMMVRDGGEQCNTVEQDSDLNSCCVMI